MIMETIQSIILDIKNLEIQGAENIAKAAVRAFGIKLKETKNRAELEKTVKTLEEARATEPALRNALKYCLINYEKENVVEKAIAHFEEGNEKIAEIGAKKIHDNMIIFTHCHSSTVMEILKKAWKDGKKFQVRNTETRPKYQGRKTAQELAEAGIPVTHYVDSAGRVALKKADLFLFGTDSITAEGKIINKIGTETLVHIANERGIPAYACTNSWKFNPETIQGEEEEIEERDAKEVWENPPKGVTIKNPAFEVSPADMITGVITELGIFKSEALVQEIRRVYPWMLQ